VVCPRVKFWRFSNSFYSQNNYSWDNWAVSVNKHLIGQHGHMTRHRFIVWHLRYVVTSELSIDMNIHVYGA